MERLEVNRSSLHHLVFPIEQQHLLHNHWTLVQLHSLTCLTKRTKTNPTMVYKVYSGVKEIIGFRIKSLQLLLNEKGLHDAFQLAAGAVIAA